MPPEQLKPKSVEEKRAEPHFYQEQADKMREKYPEIMKEIQEVARKAGFKEVLIDPDSQATARIDPEVLPDVIFWSERSIENINILEKFAPEFSSKGIRIVTIHEKEHLGGPAKEMMGAEERFVKKGGWRNVREFPEKFSRISLLREHQTRLQSLVRLTDYKDLFEEGRCPQIAEAVTIEEIFTDFMQRGPISLEREISSEVWQKYLPFFKSEFINMISEKNEEIRKKLLRDYRSWQKEQK